MQSKSEMPEQGGNVAKPGPVPLEQVLRVAELAQLELREDEQQDMLRDLNAILGHVAQLNELDTRDVPPMTQVNAAMHAAGGDRAAVDAGNVLREDSVRPSLDRSKAMKAAPETDGTYFKVPKVIER
ncbi:MAG: Asp-tRNA(Asn)/Glu-tRNA(Gln) amidotransferase subunit GatC [Acidobacteriaceae bacterium]